jgi:thiol:disulfide interchange protein DsbC
MLSLGCAQANEDKMRKALEQKLGGAKVESITKTQYGGLYEVRLENQLFYTDEKVSFVVAGSIIDLATMQNITEERKRKLSAIDFKSLPLELAVKTVRGDGSKVVAIFADPNCGYCKRFEKDLFKVDNVTIYTFLYPILSADSEQKSKSVWCAKDRVKAWQDLMLKGETPMNPGTCDTPIAKIVEVGKKLRVTGTPTLYFSNGIPVGGAVSLAQLEEYLGTGGPQ